MFIETIVPEPSSPSGAQCSWSFICMVAFPCWLGRTQTCLSAGSWDFHGGTLAISISSLRDPASPHRSQTGDALELRASSSGGSLDCPPPVITLPPMLLTVPPLRRTVLMAGTMRLSSGWNGPPARCGGRLARHSGCACDPPFGSEVCRAETRRQVADENGQVMY